jgi:hypothetical protein
MSRKKIIHHQIVVVVVVFFLKCNIGEQASKQASKQATISVNLFRLSIVRYCYEKHFFVLSSTIFCFHSIMMNIQGRVRRLSWQTPILFLLVVVVIGASSPLSYSSCCCCGELVVVVECVEMIQIYDLRLFLWSVDGTTKGGSVRKHWWWWGHQ